MDNTVIVAEGLAKKYSIGASRPERYSALRDAVARTMGRLAHPRIIAAEPVKDFWTLKNVSFACERGDVIGIIGRNGAGKSTLLKILSRITEPSEGRVKIKGRVASLLEVGTGFHPELTGRENIYLNGAILGMKQAEIKRKFDEIVDFAEVERFLDTPVKRYSSGMYVRLAFAVAAHLEPEILVVDEVLAVGDAEFQRKCLGRMRRVAGEGRTVLFVSHNLAAIKSLCNRALLLAGGQVVRDGTVDVAIRQYVSTSNSACEMTFPADATRPCIVSIAVDHNALAARDVVVDIAFHSPRRLQTAVGGIVLRADTGEPVWGSNSRFHSGCVTMKGLTSGILRCEARGLPIRNGTYHLSAWLADWHEDLDAKVDALSIQLGEDADDPLRPPASALGHIDWAATWSADSIKGASAA